MPGRRRLAGLRASRVATLGVAAPVLIGLAAIFFVVADATTAEDGSLLRNGWTYVGIAALVVLLGVLWWGFRGPKLAFGPMEVRVVGLGGYEPCDAYRATIVNVRSGTTAFGVTADIFAKEKLVRAFWKHEDQMPRIDRGELDLPSGTSRLVDVGLICGTRDLALRDAANGEVIRLPLEEGTEITLTVRGRNVGREVVGHYQVTSPGDGSWEIRPV